MHLLASAYLLFNLAGPCLTQKTPEKCVHPERPFQVWYRSAFSLPPSNWFLDLDFSTRQEALAHLKGTPIVWCVLDTRQNK
jgi:hypothetical protein